MNFKPLNKKILIERISQEETSAEGIFLPSSSKEAFERGSALTSGSEVAIGDLILYPRAKAEEISISGRQLLLIKESDILGVIER